MELERANLDRFQRINRIATLDPVTCRKDDTILEAVHKIIKSEHEKLPVIDRKNKLLGLLSFMDILEAFLRKHNLGERVSTIMIRDMVLCDVDDTVDFVLQKIKLSRKGMLPVVNGEKLAGVVSESDFVKHFSNIEFGMNVEEIMTKKPFYISSAITVLDALKRAVNVKYRRLPVVEDTRLVGLFATFDALYPIQSRFNFNEPITTIMCKRVFTVKKDDDLSDAIKIMKQNRIDGLPVVDEQNHLEGIITERDILEEIV